MSSAAAKVSTKLRADAHASIRLRVVRAGRETKKTYVKNDDLSPRGYKNIAKENVTLYYQNKSYFETTLISTLATSQGSNDTQDFLRFILYLLLISIFFYEFIKIDGVEITEHAHAIHYFKNYLKTNRCLNCYCH